MGHGTLRRQVQWHFLVLLHLRTWGPDLGCLSNQASKLLERSEKVEDPAQPMLEFLEPGSFWYHPVGRSEQASPPRMRGAWWFLRCLVPSEESSGLGLG